MELDAAFEAKEELAHAIRDSLSQTMSNYGYAIIQVSQSKHAFAFKGGGVAVDRSPDGLNLISLPRKPKH